MTKFLTADAAYPELKRHKHGGGGGGGGGGAGGGADQVVAMGPGGMPPKGTLGPYDRPASNVDTRKYESSHGKGPSGRGSWGFFMDGNRDQPISVKGIMTYSDARKVALEYAKANGHKKVEVAP